MKRLYYAGTNMLVAVGDTADTTDHEGNLMRRQILDIPVYRESPSTDRRVRRHANDIVQQRVAPIPEDFLRRYPEATAKYRTPPEFLGMEWRDA